MFMKMKSFGVTLLFVLFIQTAVKSWIHTHVFISDLQLAYATVVD